MQTLDLDTVRSLLLSPNPVTHASLEMLLSTKPVRTFRIPEDAGTKTNLSRILMHLLPELDDRPGHLFDSNEMADAASLPALVFYFNCGAVVASLEGDVVPDVSHDEMVDIFISDAGSPATPDLETLDRFIAAHADR